MRKCRGVLSVSEKRNFIDNINISQDNGRFVLSPSVMSNNDGNITYQDQEKRAEATKRVWPSAKEEAASRRAQKM